MLLSQNPARPLDTMVLQQSISKLSAGSSVHLELDWTLKMNGKSGINFLDGTRCYPVATVGTTELWRASLPVAYKVLEFAQVRVNVTGTLDADADFLRISFGCQGMFDAQMTVDNVELSIFEATQGSNPIVPQPRQVLINPSFVENGSFRPWEFGGRENSRYTLTTRPGSVTYTVRAAGTDAITNMVQSFQQGNWLEKGQSYRFSADVIYDIPNEAASCSGYVQIPGARVTIWLVQNVRSSQTFNLDFRNVAPETVTSMSFGFQCTDPKQQISVTLANVSLVANPGP